MSDTRIVYGARCLWWDSIDKVGHDGPLPTCPHCGSVLYEMANEERWWELVRAFEADGNPGYVAMMKWSRGRCFPSTNHLRVAYAEQVADDTSNLAIAHLAGEPDGPIQKCVRCDYVLTDYTDAVGPVGDWSPGFWTPGNEVTVVGLNPRVLTDGRPGPHTRACNEALH